MTSRADDFFDSESEVDATETERAEFAARAPAPSDFYYEYDDGLPQIWVRGEYLMWFTRGNSLPPLLTTSPDYTPRPTAGVLDAQTTSVRFGGEKVDENFRPGGRLRAGYRLDDVAPCYLELDFFGLGDGANTNYASPFSTGSPILARPIFNTQSGQEDAQLVAYPGLVDGQFMTRTSSELFSSAFLLRRNVAENANVRCDFLGGYRFFQYRESLRFDEHMISREISTVILPGTEIDVTDVFATRNTFNGADFGLNFTFERGPLTIDLLGKIAFGNLHQRIVIQGETNVTKPGDAPFTRTGGLLALPSNMGVQSHDDFAVLPELGANARFRLTDRLSLTAGYNWLLLNKVARTGDQIDRHIDPTQLSSLLQVPGSGGPATSPTAGLNTTTFWAVGVSAGLELSF